MPRWSHLPLQTKFGLALGGLLVLFVGGLSVVLGLLVQRQREMRSALATRVPALTSSAAMERTFLSLDDAALRYYLTGDEGWLRLRRRQEAELARAREAALSADSTLQERQLMARFDEMYQESLSRRKVLDEARRNGPLSRALTGRLSMDQAGLPAMLEPLAQLRSIESAELVEVNEASELAARQAVKLVAAAGLLLVPGLWFFGVFLSRHVVEPVGRLAAFAARVGRLGADEESPAFPQLPVEGGDELASLAESLNRMSARLGEQVRQLKQLDRLKSKFLSMVSHEFRIPLTSVGEYVAMLQEGLAGPVTERQSEHLEVIAKNARRLTVLIENLLSLAKIEAGKFAVHKTRTLLPPLCREVALNLTPLGREKGVKIELHMEAGLPPVAGDSGALVLALTNLVGNAIKYGPSRASVQISARREGDRVRVSVTDTGPGVSPEEVPRLFAGFYRGTSKDFQGTGLGLAITKEIVESHRGRLEVDSEPGRGAVFRFDMDVWRDA